MTGMASPLDLLMAAALDTGVKVSKGMERSDGSETDTIVQTRTIRQQAEVQSDSERHGESRLPDSNYPNPRVAGVKRKASGGLSPTARLPASLASILSSSSEFSPMPSDDNVVLPIPLSEDSGIIRCICSFDDDDGFTIQCERCFAWQHGLCVNISPEAVPDIYVCPLCSAGLQGNLKAGDRGTGGRNRGISRQDRERANELQTLRKEVEARLRKQRLAAGLPSSSSGSFEGATLSASDQDGEYELLAHAREIAYQKSLTLLLPVSLELGKANFRTGTSATSGVRRSKSRSPAGPPFLQSAATISEKHNILTGGTGAGTNVNTALLPSLTLDTANMGQTGVGKQKRRSGGYTPSLNYDEGEETGMKIQQDSPYTAPFGSKDTPGGSQSAARRRRSGGASVNSFSGTGKEKDAQAIGGPEPKYPTMPIANGAVMNATAGNLSSAIANLAAKPIVRPVRARLSASIPIATPSSTQGFFDNATGPTSASLSNGVSASAPFVGSRASTPTANGNNHSSDDDLDILEERYEPWQFEYTPTAKLRWSSKKLQKDVSMTLEKYIEGERDKVSNGRENDSTLSTSASQKYVEKDTLTALHPHLLPYAEDKAVTARPTLPNSASFLTSAGKIRTGSPGLSSGSSTPAHSGVLSALSSPMSPLILSFPFNFPTDLPKLSVKPLATSSLSLAPPACTPFSGPTCIPSLMNPYPRPTIHGVFSTSSYTSGTLLSVLFGQVLSGEKYRADPVNQWKDMGVLKNHTRGLGQPWDLVLDQRRWGDESRFLRQGCHPNVYVRPIIKRKAKASDAKDVIPPQSGGQQTGKKGRKQRRLQRQQDAIGHCEEWEFGFGLYALQDISKREELVLPFDWADDHVIHSLHTPLFSPQLVFPSIPVNVHSGDTDDSSDDGIPSTSSYPVLSQAQKHQIATATKYLYRLSRLASTSCLTLLGTTICACEKRRDCAVAWLWKLASFTESSNRNRTGTIRLQDFDLNGLKAAFSAALATEEKDTGYQSRRLKRTGVKRRADLGALIGLSRGWLKQQYNSPVPAVLPDTEEYEQETIMQLMPSSYSRKVNYHASPRKKHAFILPVPDTPLSELVSQATQEPSDAADMLMPTPTSGVVKSNKEANFDFAHNIPPILRRFMLPQKDKEQNEANDGATASMDSDGQVRHQEDKDGSESDLTEPLPSDGEVETAMDVQEDEDEVVVPPKKKKKMKDSNSSPNANAEEVIEGRSMEILQVYDRNASKGSKIAREAVQDLRPESTKKRDFSLQARRQLPASARDKYINLSKTPLMTPHSLALALTIPTEIEKTLEVKEDDAIGAMTEAPLVQLLIPKEAPALDGLFEAPISSPPPAPSLSTSQTHMLSESSKATSQIETLPITLSTEMSTQSEESVSAAHSAIASVMKPTEAAGPGLQSPASAPLRKLSFKAYKQRAAMSVPRATVSELVVEKSKAHLFTAGQSHPSLIQVPTSEATEKDILPAKSDHNTVFVPDALVPHVPEEIQPEIVTEELRTSPSSAPPLPPLPRARLSFAAYRQRLSAGRTGTTPPAVTDPIMEFESKTQASSQQPITRNEHPRSDIVISPSRFLPASRELEKDIFLDSIPKASAAKEAMDALLVQQSLECDKPAREASPTEDISRTPHVNRGIHNSVPALPQALAPFSDHGRGRELESEGQLTDQSTNMLPMKASQLAEETEEEGEVVPDPRMEPGELNVESAGAAPTKEILKAEETPSELASRDANRPVSKRSLDLMRPEYPHDMLSHSADVARNNEARPPDPMKYDGTSYHAGISTLAKSRSPSRTEKTSQAPLHTLLTTAEEISITNIRGSSPPFAIDGRERLSQGRSGNFSRKSPPASSPAASAGPRALQPPTGPRNLAASGTWGRSSGRGTYNSTLKGRDPAIHGEGFGTSGTGGSSYRPAPLPPSAPKAERAVQLPSGPRALRGGYQAPTRGAFRDRAKYEGIPSAPASMARDQGWPTRGRGRGRVSNRGHWSRE